MKRLVAEAGMVLVAGMVFALAANWLSRRGLVLNYNYFPGVKPVSVAPSTNSDSTNLLATATNGLSGASNALARVQAWLKANGLQMADSNQVMQLYHDPRYPLELVIFVDARGDADYQKGHVPGAYQFDHFHPAEYLATVLAASQNAEQIVVYCNGGDCEESEFAALALSEADVPKQKLLVYVGGWMEWTNNRQPVELGARKSGQIQEGAK